MLGGSMPTSASCEPEPCVVGLTMPTKPPSFEVAIIPRLSFAIGDLLTCSITSSNSPRLARLVSSISTDDPAMVASFVRRFWYCAAAALVSVVALSVTTQADAQDVEQAFRGKQIRFLIGSSAGGGYDLFARTIAAHWTKHIPGNPIFVPQNVPGALSLQVANNIFSVAPKDGTVIGAVNPQIVSRAILDSGAARFDAR